MYTTVQTGYKFNAKHVLTRMSHVFHTHKNHACIRVYTHRHACSWFDMRGISKSIVFIDNIQVLTTTDMPSYLATVIVNQLVDLWLYIVHLRRSLVQDNHV